MSAIEVALFGTLGRDAEHKTSAKGKAYLRANIAVSQGEETTWVNAMAVSYTHLTLPTILLV